MLGHIEADGAKRIGWMVRDHAGWRNLEATYDDHPEFPPPMHPEHGPAEPEDAGLPRETLKSTEAPPPSRYTEDKVGAVEDFIGRVIGIQEGDFGDWMRRANNYWWALHDSLAHESAAVRDYLEDIQQTIQFLPDFKIMETRRRVVQMAMRIREMLGGEPGWEPKDFGVELTKRTREPAIPNYSLRQPDPERPKVESVVRGPGNDMSINGAATGFPEAAR